MKIKGNILLLSDLFLGILFVSSFGLAGCDKKSEDASSSSPVITLSITNISYTSAKCGGNILSQGAAPITQRGVCLSTSSTPTTNNTHTTDGSGTGTFVSYLTGLTRNTLYYIRAYATDSAGKTIYGNELSFNTLNEPSVFQYTIENDTQVSDRIFEFDLFIKDVDSTEVFELAAIQGGILVNKSISTTPTTGLSVSIVAGNSQLVTEQQPTIVAIADGAPNNPSQMIIKMASRIPPGCGNGTIIGTTGLGTRICRIRITNTVAFATNSKADLYFCFTTSPYPTKVFQYYGSPCISNQITCDATSCNTGTTYLNIILNP